MPLEPGMAHLSDVLRVAATVAYTLAMYLYAVEYAFGRRAVRAARSAVPVAEPALVGAALATPAAVGTPAGSAGAAPAAGGSGGSGGPSIPGRSDEAPAIPARSGEAPAIPAQVGAGGVGGAGGRTRVVWFGYAAVAVTVAGWLLHAASLVTRGLAAGRVPWGNMYEFVLAVTLVGVGAYLVLLTRQPVRYLGAFVMVPVVLLLGLAGTVLYTRVAPLVPALNSYWLKIHVTAAVIASGVFMVSFATASLQLLRDRHDRMVAAGRPTGFATALGARLPAAASLERATFTTIAFAFPIWTFAIMAGAIWAEAAWGRYWGWDPKETWSFIAWVIYAAYLHARSTGGWRGRRSSWIAVLGWVTMLFNLFAVNLVIAGLHSYAGVT